jgi:hypothetical protein
MVPKRLIKKINFGGNGNHTFFVSGDIGLCVNQGTGFLEEKVYARKRNYVLHFQDFSIKIILSVPLKKKY